MADVTLDPTTRAPTSAPVGGLRAAVVLMVATKLAGLLNGIGLGIDPTMLAGALAGVVSFVGKTLRDRGYAWAQF